jgi:hypothetical protein
MKKLAAFTAALALVVTAGALAANKTFTVSMNGKSETPKGAPNGKGTAKITLESGKVCFKLSWSGIGTPNASHIHKGKKGVAGQVVIPLFGGAPKHSGCVKVAQSLINKIKKNPAGYYVNVHTAKFPAGAIRAQL